MAFYVEPYIQYSQHNTDPVFHHAPAFKSGNPMAWYEMSMVQHRKSFMFNVFKQSFIYTMQNLYPSFDFDASNSQNLK